VTEARFLTKAPQLLARLLPVFGFMNQAANMFQRLRELAQFDAELRNLSRDTQQYQEMLDKIESQRAPLPTSILVHYDRRTARGKLAIAPVRRGVCGACHLSIPSGRLADLRRKPGELNVCDNCGVFIYLIEDESAARNKSASDHTAVKKAVEAKRTLPSAHRKKAQITASESGAP
jgi:predicted  nucleic acid-binding Zn-ribbon protein